jgi:hypothetical protein
MESFPGFSVAERMLRFDASGAGRVPALGPGRYRIKSAGGAFVFDPQEIELTSDSSEPIVIHWLKKER